MKFEKVNYKSLILDNNAPVSNTCTGLKAKSAFHEVTITSRDIKRSTRHLSRLRKHAK